MSSKTTNEIFWSHVNVFTGTAGALASIPAGYIMEEGTVDISSTREIKPVRVQGKKLPVHHFETGADLRVITPLAQVTEDLIALVMGETKDGQVVTMSESGAILPQFSFAAIGNDIAGDTIRLDIPYANSVGNLSLSPTQTDAAVMPLEIAAIDQGARPYFTFDDGNIEATISGGEITRTSGFHKLLGEGDAADAIDSITGSGLVDNETLRFQTGKAANALTFVHLNGTLELVGDASFVLSNSDSYIDFKYDLSGTKWDEIRRFDASI